MGSVAPLLPLVRRGLRRARGQALTTALLAVVAGALLNLGLVLAVDFPGSFERSMARLGTEDTLTVVTTERLATTAQQALDARSDVVAHDIQPVRSGVAMVSDYNGAEAVGFAVFYDYDRPPTIGAPSVVEELAEPRADGIYLPYQFARGGGFRPGDPITLQVGSTRSTFRVQGIVEAPFTGSFMAGVVGFGFPHEGYRAFAADTPAPQAWLVRAQGRDPSRAEDLEAFVARTLQGAGAGADLTYLPFSTSRTVVESALKAGASLFTALLVLFAWLVAGVALAVIAVQVRTALTQEMPAIGTLKAVGFTSGQVIGALALQQVVIVALGALAGAGASYGAMPTLEASLAAQTGLRWGPGVQPLALALTVLALAGAAGLTALVVARRARRVPPVDALRGGRPAHSFQCNPLPLDRSRGGLTWLLGLKQAARRPAQNALVMAVLAAVTATTVFSVAGAAYLANPRSLYDVSLGDWGDVWVVPRPGADREEVRARLATLPGVSASYYDDLMLQATSPAGILLVRATPDYGVLANDSVIEGRAPRFDNEVSIGSGVAERTGLGPGDEITLGQADHRARYLVTGIGQSSFGLGLNAQVTDAGYRRISPAYAPAGIRLRTDPGVDLPALIEQARDDPGVEAAIDSEAYRATMLGTLAEASRGLAQLYILVSALIGVLVVGLVVAGALLAGRRAAGIQKALGFTTGQLTRQLVASQLPVAALGILLGLALGRVVTEPLMSLSGRLSGVSRLPVVPDAGQLVGVGAALTLLTLLTLVLMSLRLRGVSALELVRE